MTTGEVAADPLQILLVGRGVTLEMQPDLYLADPPLNPHLIVDQWVTVVEFDQAAHRSKGMKTLKLRWKLASK